MMPLNSGEIEGWSLPCSPLRRATADDLQRHLLEMTLAFEQPIIVESEFEPVGYGNNVAEALAAIETGNFEGWLTLDEMNELLDEENDDDQ